MKRRYLLFFFIVVVLVFSHSEAFTQANDCESFLNKLKGFFNEIPQHMSSETDQKEYKQKLKNLEKEFTLQTCSPNQIMVIKSLFYKSENRIRYAYTNQIMDQSRLDRYKENKKAFCDKFEELSQLTCTQCINILSSYYEQFTKRQREEKNKDKDKFTQEAIGELWGLLYRLSEIPECLQTTESQRILQNIMLPSGIPADILTKELVNVLRGQPKEVMTTFRDEILNYSREEDQILLFKIFTQIAIEGKSHTLKNWLEIIESVTKIDSAQERKILFEILPSIEELKTFEDLLLDFKKNFKSRQDIRIGIKDFILTDIHKDISLEQQGFLNEKFIEVFKSTYSVTPLKDFGMKAEDLLFIIDGHFSQEETKYILTLKFSTKNTRLYTETLELPLRPFDRSKVEDSYKKVFENFENFINALLLLPLNKSEIIISLTDFEEKRAILYTDVYETSLLLKLTDSENLKYNIAGVYIAGDLFWVKDGNHDREATRIFGNNFKDLIEDKINKLYITKGANVRILSGEEVKKLPPNKYLRITGEYSKITQRKSYSSITIYYNLGKRNIINEYWIYFPDQKLLEDKETLKDMLIAKIGDNIAHFIDFKPVQCKPPVPCEPKVIERIVKPPLKNPYLISFFMPLYQRNYYEDNPGLFPRAWQWSNFIFMGISITSGYLYIQDEYEDDNLLDLCVNGTGALLANGLLGVLDVALFSKRPQRGILERSTIGPSLNYNIKNDVATLVFSYKF